MINRKVVVLLPLLGLAILFSLCTEKQDEMTKTSVVKPVNPNGDSEMAILMRAMYDSAASVRTLVQDGRLPGELPEIFFTLHKAKPTDSTVKNENFDDFATSYLESLKQLHTSDVNNVKENYNFLLNKCVDCHSQYCPGPIKAINKLRVQ